MSSYRRKAIDPEVIQENGRELVLQLVALHFFNLNRNCPTNAGYIVFGKDVLGRFPGAYVQYVKFAGETMGDEVVEDYRNPILAEVLLVMKYANRYGRGISRAQHLLAQNDNRPAEFHIGANFIKVTVFKHPERWPGPDNHAFANRRSRSRNLHRTSRSNPEIRPSTHGERRGGVRFR